MTTVTFLPAWYGPDDYGPFDTEAQFELDPDNFCDHRPPERLRLQFFDAVPWERFWVVWRSRLKERLDAYLREKTNGECRLAFSLDGTWMAQVPLAAAARRLKMSEEGLLELREDDSIRFDEMLCGAYELTADHIHQDLVANWSLPDPFGVLEELAAQHGELLRKAAEYRRRGQGETAEHLEECAQQAARAALALRHAKLLREAYG